MSASAPNIVEGLPIERVLFVQRMERPAGFTWDGFTNPGHHLNVVEAGRVRVECNGLSYLLGRGDVIWYHEAEQQKLRVLDAPWVFYGLNFIAPSLPPPNFEHRCIHLPRKDSLAAFGALLRTWRDTSVPYMVRAMRVQAALLTILADLVTPVQWQMRFGQNTSLWWDLESSLRKNIRQPIDMKTMCQIAKRSRATVIRACQSATGTSPLKRAKQIRLSMAHGLVILSDLTISEIADRVGYARIHELSRDYHKQFGISPTQNREQYPKIYRREFGLPFISTLSK